MREYRCMAPHPSRPGQPCDGLLMRIRDGDMSMGAIEVHCKKHRGNVWVNTSENYTTSGAVSFVRVDKAATVA